MDLVSPPIQKSFSSSQDVDGFRLSLPEIEYKAGELVFLMGHNGSGKSVYGKLISGEMRSDIGISKLNWVSKVKSEGPSLGVVQQQVDHNLALDLTVQENILLRFSYPMFSSFSRPGKKAYEWSGRVLKTHTELLKKMHHQAATLSLGQRQTLAFLCERSISSDALLLDEFLASTDHSTSKLLMDMVHEFLNEDNGVVIIISHAPLIALNEADRIIVFQHGRLAKDIRKGDQSWNLECLENLIRV